MKAYEGVIKVLGEAVGYWVTGFIFFISLFAFLNYIF
tara:strand:+ start:753 stop:863 length:111 start_codon:yes stop_codon:yes gene_type:complete